MTRCAHVLVVSQGRASLLARYISSLCLLSYSSQPSQLLSVSYAEPLCVVNENQKPC
jgi:hypothetical protein